MQQSTENFWKIHPLDQMLEMQQTPWQTNRWQTKNQSQSHKSHYKGFYSQTSNSQTPAPSK